MPGQPVEDDVRLGDQLQIFSKVGIVLLLFIVGLHLNPQVIREVGKVSILTGVGQIIFTSVIGFAISMLLGLDRVAAIYVSIAMTFSSTIIILKLLSDKKDLQKYYAKIAIGFLLVQDIIATIALILIAMISQQGSQDLLTILSTTILKGSALLVFLLVMSTFILPRLTRFLANSQELLFLFSLAWGTGMASYVIMPHHLGVQYAAKLIHKLGIDVDEFNEEKTRHLELLQTKYAFM